MIPELAHLLKSSIEECLEDEVGVSFSGGIDSSLIAHIANKHSKVFAYSAGMENSEDLVYAKEVARLLEIEQKAILLTEEEILKLYEEVYRITPAPLLKIEILIPIYASAKKAKENNLEVFLVGSGAEELFVGYNRYYRYLEEGKDLDSILKQEFRNLNKGDAGLISKVIRKVGLEPRYPFMNNKLANYVFSIPLEKRIEEKELKKGLIREAGKLLKLPEIVLKRKKKAVQYGSGIHKILIRNSDILNEKFPPKL